ncbi:hypothetical protein ACT3R7_06790 [Halomonas sp. AOP43-A1-21]|uniref:Rubredoxin-like domain-containing protein n=1 Tax=Halomonas colorata TaxID=2742615 RepID=A0ABR9G3T6_9GAMM|nr:hypothetical protein [Halomonas colorata]MBE0465539.1 hypothetical protein [Halomonas colorata]
MKHPVTCQKCGHEYVPEAEAEVPHDHPCSSCGAELYGGEPRSAEDDSSEDEHPIEKGLRKFTDGITGDKHDV